MALITNKQLLVDLGFNQGEVTEKNNRYWHHASGTTLVLPNNKVLETATQADLPTVGGHLDNGATCRKWTSGHSLLKAKLWPSIDCRQFWLANLEMRS